MIAIYKITNITNGMVYVGQSVNIIKRWNEHKRNLRKGAHENKKLQNAWNIYGEDSFLFSIIETCEEAQLGKKEIKWCNNLCSLERDKGYNIAYPGHSPMLHKHHKISSRLKMSKWRRDNSSGKENGFYGKRHTKETLDKISLALKGKFTGNKNPMYNHCGIFNSFYGKKHKLETKELMSKNHADFSGEKHPRSKLKEKDVLLIIDLLLKGAPTKELSARYNVSISCISGIMSHKNWKYLTDGIVFPRAKKHRLAETTISPSL